MARRSEDTAAWLKSIELENVRCFHDRQIVPFTTSEGERAQWTLLLGENGTGKSTLLQLCAMLMPRAWEPRPDGTFFARSQGDEGIHAIRWLGLPRDGLPRRAVAGVALTLGVTGGEARWSWDIEPVDGALRTGSSSRPPPAPSVAPRLPLCLSYAPYRSPWSFIPEDASPDEIRGIFIGFTRLRHPGLWFKDRMFASVNPDGDEGSRRAAAKLVDRVRETLLRLLPDVSDLRIDTELGGRGENRLRAHTPYGWVDIDRLGMGYQSTLALIVDIASRLVEHHPDSPDPLGEPAIVLIDEVDLHLHPTWQRTLQQQLSERFPNVQFIATAHSPLVVQSAPSANILLLRRAKDHVVIERAPEAVKSWRVDQILTSDLFGLPSPRPPRLDPLLKERDEILGKAELTRADERRLEEVRAQIGALPGGDSPWEMEAMELIRSAAATLTPQKGKATRRATRKTKGRG